MSHSYSTIKRLHSGNKSISVIHYKGRKCVIKIYDDNKRPQTEARIMGVISKTGYAPEVVESRDNYIISQYIEGQSLADSYRMAMIMSSAPIWKQSSTFLTKGYAL